MTTATQVRRRLDPSLDRAATIVPVLLLLVAGYDQLAARLRSGAEPDRGASVVELVLITAFIVTVVAVIGVALRQKLVDKTAEIDFTTPGGAAPAAG